MQDGEGSAAAEGDQQESSNNSSLHLESSAKIVSLRYREKWIYY